MLTWGHRRGVSTSLLFRPSLSLAELGSDRLSVCLSVLLLARLPFLRHGLEQTPTHSKILRYISNIPRTDSISISRPDSRLSKDDHASLVALTAFVNSDLSDLVNHSLFSLPLNWLAEVRPAYASNLPIPQRYYLPSKKRTEVRDRLEREGLWGLGGDAEVEEEREKRKKEFLTDHSDLRVMDRIKKAEQKDQIKREFDKQKVRVR